jgi:hypothetical protein
MEERMIRGQDRLCLQVREAFEPTRLSPQCLISAYARLVPIRRASLGKDDGRRCEQADRPIRKVGGRHVT